MKDKPKKLVSPGEFVRHQMSKGTSFALGIGLLMMGLIAFVLLLLLMFAAVKEFIETGSLTLGKTWGGTGLLILFGVAILGLCCSYAAQFGVRTVKEAVDMPAVRMATAKALAELPVEEVLVRAALAPSEDAGKTLLRATVANTETPAEELLRPR